MTSKISKFLLNFFHTFVSMTNTQPIFSRFFRVDKFLPLITLPRFAFGAQIPLYEAEKIIRAIPSLASKPWTHFWRDRGLEFEAKNNYRAACMCYIMGCFPKENKPWKEEINDLKRKSFKKLCTDSGLPFQELFVDTPEGRVRLYYFRPKSAQPVPLSFFVNGLEGSAEEIAFTLQNHLDEGPGYVCLSIPGSADYEKPMNAYSDVVLKCVIDYFAGQDWVDKEQLGMVGFSMGAFWTFICTKTDSRIRYAICNGIPLHHTLSSGQGFGLNPIISEALLRIFGKRHPIQLLSVINKMIERANSLLSQKSGAILAMNGDKDSIVDPRDTAILGTQPGNRLIFIKNDDHCGLFHYDRMVSIIVRWSRRNLSLGKSKRPKLRAIG